MEKYDETQHIPKNEGSSSGSGFNKKQLTYGRGIYPPNPQQHSYLDNILDSNTTSQNKIILSQKTSNLSKYIKPLVGD